MRFFSFQDPLEQRIAAAFETFKLDFSAVLPFGCRDLPANTFKLPHLRLINLSRNRLSSLPPFASSFRLLSELILERNALSQLPSELHVLVHLRRLDLSNNHFFSVPEYAHLRPCSNYAISNVGFCYLSCFVKPLGWCSNILIF